MTPEICPAALRRFGAVGLGGFTNRWIGRTNDEITEWITEACARIAAIDDRADTNPADGLRNIYLIVVDLNVYSIRRVE